MFGRSDSIIESVDPHLHFTLILGVQCPIPLLSLNEERVAIFERCLRPKMIKLLLWRFKSAQNVSELYFLTIYGIFVVFNPLFYSQSGSVKIKLKIPFNMVAFPDRFIHFVFFEVALHYVFVIKWILKFIIYFPLL